MIVHLGLTIIPHPVTEDKQKPLADNSQCQFVPRDGNNRFSIIVLHKSEHGNIVTHCRTSNPKNL